MDKEDVVYIRMEYYLAKKKRMKFAIRNNRDEPRHTVLSEISQRNTNIVCYHIYVNIKKKKKKEQKQIHRYTIQTATAKSLQSCPTL